MFLRSKTRKKDGKIHRYWSVVENRRTHDNRVVQRQVLYLGEINDGQRATWTRAVEVFEDEGKGSKPVAIFPDDRPAPELEHEVVQVRLGELRLQHPRQWGGCWLACQLWDRLRLDEFWAPPLAASRQGTRWPNVLKILVIYRLLESLQRVATASRVVWAQWPLADLLGEERQAIPVQSLYRCLDKVLPQKKALFSGLRGRWESLFGVQFEDSVAELLFRIILFIFISYLMRCSNTSRTRSATVLRLRGRRLLAERKKPPTARSGPRAHRPFHG